MGATRTPGEGRTPSRAALERQLREAGLEARWWGNAPGDTYGWHSHPYHKVLYCADGSITFHTREGDVPIRAGDRLDIEPGTEHAATVGGEGVTCVEAPLRP